MTHPAEQSKAAFDAVWAQVSGPIMLCCRRLSRNADDAQDLYQRVAFRAWRGYPTFRGDCAVLTWLTRIAEREASRMYAAAAQRLRREVPLLVDAAGIAAAPAAGEPALTWLHDVVAVAGKVGALTDAECQVVARRLVDPDASWQQAAAELGMTAAQCAVVHCRAVPKLRVLLFVSFADALGGPAEIEAAFRSAGDELSPAERDAFAAVVLAGRDDYRRRGWQADLRRACGLVVRHLDPREVAGVP
jgi:DNA-directed RNA polymerase specialized sigma24 family protein